MIFLFSEFETLKSKALQACLVIAPESAAPVFFDRLDYREASLGHKIRLLGLMQEAIIELAGVEYNEPEFYDKFDSTQTQFDDFKSFYSEPSPVTAVDEAEEEIKTRVDAKTKKNLSYFTKSNEKKAKRNYLLAHCEKFLYPLLAIPQYSKTYMTFLEQSDLTQMYLKTLSKSSF